VGVVNLAVLACVLRATTKKSHQLFKENSAPREKNLATPMFGERRFPQMVSGQGGTEILEKIRKLILRKIDESLKLLPPDVIF